MQNKRQKLETSNDEIQKIISLSEGCKSQYELRRIHIVSDKNSKQMTKLIFEWPNDPTATFILSQITILLRTFLLDSSVTLENQKLILNFNGHPCSNQKLGMAINLMSSIIHDSENPMLFFILSHPELLNVINQNSTLQEAHTSVLNKLEFNRIKQDIKLMYLLANRPNNLWARTPADLKIKIATDASSILDYASFIQIKNTHK